MPTQLPDDDSTLRLYAIGEASAANREPVTLAQAQAQAFTPSKRMKVMRGWWQHFRNKFRS